MAERKIADFVQKQRAAFRFFQAAACAANRAPVNAPFS